MDANASSSGTYTIQGRILKPDSSPETDSSVQFDVQIRSPGAENCLLYEETQTLNMSSTSGLFSIVLNGGSGSRTDGNAFSFASIFSNGSTFTPAAGNCASGTTYTPSSFDERNLILSFKDSSMGSFEVMPTTSITHSAYSTESNMVGGFQAGNLVRVADSGIPQSVSALTSANFTELLALVGGTSTQYMSKSSSGAALPSFPSDPSGLSAGDLWYDSTNKEIKFYDGTSSQSLMIGSGTLSGNSITSGTIGGSTSMNTTGTVTASAISTSDLYAPQIYGSTSPSGTLKLDGTSDATKGYVLLNSAGGNVGIGTTTPAFTLDISAAAATSAHLGANGGNDLYLFSNGAGIGSNVYYNGAWFLNQANSASVLSLVNGSFAFSVAPSGAAGSTPTFNQVMTIANSGKVGIGTTSPGQMLSVAGDQSTSGYLRVGSNTAPTNTTAGDLTVNRLNVGNVNFSGTGFVSMQGTVTDATGTVNAMSFQPLFTPSAANTGQQRGMTVNAIWSGSNNITLGYASNYINDFRSSGSVSNALVAYNGTGLQLSGNSNNFGTINVVDGATVQPVLSFSNTVTGTINNAIGLKVSDSTITTQTLTNQAGVLINGIAAATNNTGLLMGQSTIPSGNYGIYNASANNNYFAGKVGIGTTGPTATLEVAGTAKATAVDTTSIAPSGVQALGLNTVASGVNYLTITPATAGSVPILSTAGSDAVLPLNIYTKGGGGILLAPGQAPAFKAAFTSGSVNYLQASGATAGNSPVLNVGGASANIGITLTPKGTGDTVISSGKLGIGVPTPGYTLDVAGDINTSTCLRIAGAQTTGTCSSDRRLKEDIQDYTIGLDAILGLQPKIYKLNGLAGLKKGTQEVGFIAQDVEKVVPSLVVQRMVQLHPDDRDETEIKAVNYTRFIFIAINSIKELYQEILGVNDRVAALEAENAQMKAYLCAKEPSAPFCKK